MACKAQDLDGQHREDAGHEVEDQSTHQATEQGHPQAGGAGSRRSGLVGSQGRSQCGRDAGHGGSRPAALDRGLGAPGHGLVLLQRCGALGGRQGQDHGQLGRSVAAHVGQRQFGHPGCAVPMLLPVLAQFGRVVEGVGRFGIEVQRAALQGFRQPLDAQLHALVGRPAFCCWLAGRHHLGLGRRGQCLGLERPGLGEGLTLACRAALHGQLQLEIAFLGNALHAADQPVRVQAQVQHAGRGRLEVGGHLHGHGQQHLALIAVVEQRAHAQRLGHGPLDLARRQAAGSCQFSSVARPESPAFFQ